jgi:Cu/Ag efflux protein CusF
MMMGRLKPLVVAAAILALTVPPVMAQVAPPPGPAAPGGSGPTDLAAPKSPIPPQEKVIGSVEKVDPAAKTVQVGWLRGLFSTTLEVTGATQIAVGGTKASLSDIREGERVKAAYEARDGKNIAKAIEVNPPEATAGPSREAPASPRPPQ